MAASLVGVPWGLYLYFAFRAQVIREGTLDAFPEIKDAVYNRDLTLLVQGLQQKERSSRIAACRGLLELGSRAAPTLPALIDCLWSITPAEAAWPPHEVPPTETSCWACGQRLRFWNHAWGSRCCGFCTPRDLGRPVTEEDCLPSRGWAARVLGAIGAEAVEAIPALSATESFDRSALVRDAASRALKRIRC